MNGKILKSNIGIKYSIHHSKYGCGEFYVDMKKQVKASYHPKACMGGKSELGND